MGSTPGLCPTGGPTASSVDFVADRARQFTWAVRALATDGSAADGVVRTRIEAALTRASTTVARAGAVRVDVDPVLAGRRCSLARDRARRATTLDALIRRKAALTCRVSIANHATGARLSAVDTTGLAGRDADARDFARRRSAALDASGLAGVRRIAEHLARHSGRARDARLTILIDHARPIHARPARRATRGGHACGLRRRVRSCVGHHRRVDLRRIDRGVDLVVVDAHRLRERARGQRAPDEQMRRGDRHGMHSQAALRVCWQSSSSSIVFARRKQS